jgi:hypothetical protein
MKSVQDEKIGREEKGCGVGDPHCIKIIFKTIILMVLSNRIFLPQVSSVFLHLPKSCIILLFSNKRRAFNVI